MRNGEMIGAVVLHGFNNSGKDIEEIVQFLQGWGIKAIAPTMCGNEGAKDDWNTTSWQEWVEIAVKTYEDLKEQCSKVIVVGYSMGGLVAMYLAAMYEVEMLALINTPVFYQDMRKTLELVLDQKCKSKGEVAESVGGFVKTTPFWAAMQFFTLQGQLVPLIGQVSVPVIVLQGLRDEIVHWKSAEYIYEMVDTNKKRKVYYRKGKHHILTEPFIEDICYEIFHFILRVV